MECVFCCESFVSSTEFLELSCNHISCLSCLKGLLAASNVVRCRVCSGLSVYESEKLEDKTWEKLGKESGDGNLQKNSSLMCDVCQNSTAVSFCITCQKLLCRAHKKEDRQKTFSDYKPDHAMVKVERFAERKSLYLKCFCHVHSDTEVSKACSICLKLICQHCDVEEECKDAICPVWGHLESPLSEIAQSSQNKLEEYVLGLDAKIAELFSLEKDALNTIERINEKKRKWMMEIEETVKDTIACLTERGDQLKMKIEEFIQRLLKSAEGNIAQIKAVSEEANEHMRCIKRIQDIALPALVVENFSHINKSVEKLLSYKGRPVAVVSRNSQPGALVSVHDLKLKSIFEPPVRQNLPVLQKLLLVTEEIRLSCIIPLKDDVESKNTSQDDGDPFEKFQVIFDQISMTNVEAVLKLVQNLPFKTENDLKQVAKIVFDKAVTDQASTPACALLCRNLRDLKVQSQSYSTAAATFRKFLLCQSQHEYENIDTYKEEKIKRLKAALEQASFGSRKKLEEVYQQFSQHIHLRKLGNMRFMGELFKVKCLVPKIVHDCLAQLLGSSNEEDLECLCTLLTTAGKELDTEEPKVKMDEHFNEILRLACNLTERVISDRVKAALQELLLLRKNNWIRKDEQETPRRRLRKE